MKKSSIFLLLKKILYQNSKTLDFNFLVLYINIKQLMQVGNNLVLLPGINIE